MQHNPLLEQLYSGHSLSTSESTALFNAVIQGELSNEQIAAMLIALKVRGANTEEISGAVAASLQNAKAFPYPNYPFADIVGQEAMVKTLLIFPLPVRLLRHQWE
ncbi:anthranilate phosphoribosyltransferase [Haemophilus influenzae]|uniref:Anthranilate phosphoribosyltransferase n=1 Tax=Haemophilus influenzae TaxID=727 RepID=A0A2X1PIT4_HAEIF|nr:anthranilate phosphoribosyltransferase [Haemophilus influenzae]